MTVVQLGISGKHFPRVLRSRAIHEAGHAVFIWRGKEVIDGDRFDDSLADFREVLINPHDWDEHGDLPPLQLSGGALRENAGAVVMRSCRLTVPCARGLTGLPRVQHRAMINHAKLRAAAEVTTLLAGPIAQTRLADGDDWFDWRTWLDEQERAGDTENEDVARALAIAESELCRGPRQTVRYLDNAVEQIEATLTGDVRYVRAINALAGELLARLRLDHDMAVSVMREAWRGGDIAAAQECHSV